MAQEERSPVGRLGTIDRWADHNKFMAVGGQRLWRDLAALMHGEEYLAEPPLKLKSNLDVLYLQWSLWGD